MKEGGVSFNQNLRICKKSLPQRSDNKMTTTKEIEKVEKAVRFATAVCFCVIQIFSYSSLSLAAEVTVDPNTGAQTPVVAFNPDAVPSTPPASSNAQPHQSTDEPSPLSLVASVQAEATSSSTTTTTQAPSNSNFSFVTVKTDTEISVYLKNKQTGKQNLITTTTTDRTIGGLDVDPSGDFAYVNVRRRETTSTGYVDTGDILLYHIGLNQIIQKVTRVSPVTGEILGKETIQREVGSYTFLTHQETSLTGVLLTITRVVFNTTESSFNEQTGSMDSTSHGAILKTISYYNNYSVRYTQIWERIFMDSLVSVPGQDKLLFGGVYSNDVNEAVGIYDVNKGTVKTFLLSNPFRSFVAVSTSGEYAIASTTGNKIVAIRTRSTTANFQLLGTDCPSIYRCSSSDASVSSGQFITSLLANVNLEVGIVFQVDFSTIPSTSQPLAVYDHLENFRFSYGLATDKPVVADLNFDGRQDVAVFRNGQWHIDTDGNRLTVDKIITYGAPGDLPVLADWNNDTKVDMGVFRNGVWHIDLNGDAKADLLLTFGTAGDIPIPADYNRDGKVDLAVYRPTTGTWFIDYNRDGKTDKQVNYGGSPGDIPIVADLNADGLVDRAIYRKGVWIVDSDLDGKENFRFTYGNASDIPVVGDAGRDGWKDLAVFRKATFGDKGTWIVDSGSPVPVVLSSTTTAAASVSANYYSVFPEGKKKKKR